MLQLTLDIQIAADQPKITIAAPYSLGGRLKVVDTYRLQFSASEISRSTGLSLAEIRKLTTLLDKLTPAALAIAYAGKIAEGVALRLAKLSPEDQTAIVLKAGEKKITGPLVDDVLAEQRAEVIMSLSEDLIMPGEFFTWQPTAPAPITSHADQSPPANDRDRLLAGLIAALENLPEEALWELVEICAKKDLERIVAA